MFFEFEFGISLFDDQISPLKEKAGTSSLHKALGETFWWIYKAHPSISLLEKSMDIKPSQGF
jgi:hypothetical protein